MFKRIVSLVLIIAVLTTATCISAFAVSDTDEKDFLFYDNLYELIQGQPNDTYEEVYYHHIDENDPESTVDWAIVFYLCNAGDASMVKYIVFDRVLTNFYMDAIFTVGWAVYDVNSDKFMSIESIDVSKYDGLEEALDEAKVGNPFGDADLDGRLTISDATYIQRVLADLCEYSIYDDLTGYNTWGFEYDRQLKFISDIDDDGERTIMDATAIQMKLAKK